MWTIKPYYHRLRRRVYHWRNSVIDRRPKLLVLLYHHVLPKAGSNPYNVIVSLDTFKRHMETIVKKYRVIALGDCITGSALAGSRDEMAVVLTFDDGFRDNYEIVFPILKQNGLTATFFLTTDRIGHEALWDDLFITWEQAREMSSQGMEIGSHGLSHRPLTRMPFDEAEREIKKSKDVIERNTGKGCTHFAFPYGSRIDYSTALIEAVRKAGYQSCMLNIHGYNHWDDDRFCLRRIIMQEAIDLRFLLG